MVQPGSIVRGKRFFLLQNVQTCFAGPPSLLFNVYRSSFPGVKRCGVKLTVKLHLMSRFKYEWSHSSTTLCVLMAWTGTTLLSTRLIGDFYATCNLKFEFWWYRHHITSKQATHYLIIHNGTVVLIQFCTGNTRFMRLTMEYDQPLPIQSTVFTMWAGKVQAMKAYRERRGVAPFILNFETSRPGRFNPGK
jgi:hypothetical protein